jgi:hypothetical protein
MMQASPNLALHMTDDTNDLPPEDDLVQEPRLWQGNGWTARVIKNEDDEGWAVAMIKDGEPEPALVGPWTMGRDKKQLHAQLHKSTVVVVNGQELKITLDIVPDEDHPYATLSAFDAAGERVAQARVAASFKLTPASASQWADNEFRAPRQSGD